MHEAAEATYYVFVMEALQYIDFLQNFGVVPFARSRERNAFQDYISTGAFVARFVDGALINILSTADEDGERCDPQGAVPASLGQGCVRW